MEKQREFNLSDSSGPNMSLSAIDEVNPFVKGSSQSETLPATA